ncbi:hypothetical protein HHI36_016263, partial [Cryptolaemus montrouzieri]
MKEIRNIIPSELQKTGSTINVHYYSSPEVNFKRDIAGILSIASCDSTWRLFERTDRESIPYMAISEAECPRLPEGKAVSIPLVADQEEMPQLLLDLRTSHAVGWRDIILIYDNSI